MTRAAASPPGLDAVGTAPYAAGGRAAPGPPPAPRGCYPATPYLRRLATAARALGAMTRLMLGRGADATEEFQLRCATFALVAGFLSCAFYGTLMGVSGERWQALNMAAASALYAGCVALYRRTRRIVLLMNAMAATTWLAIVFMMLLQGGIHTPTSWWLVTLSYLLATAGLPRSALAWLGIIAATVFAFLWLERLGYVFPVRFGGSPLLFQFSAQVGLFGLIVFFALVLSAARAESTRRAEDAYRQALAASAAKSRFLATMSHEIRTPLNGVIGAAELLVTTDVTPAQRRLVDTLKHSGLHLKSLVDDILDFSRIEAGMLELEQTEFDPAELVRQTVEGLAVVARGRQLYCECRIAPAVPSRVVGDPARLRQIVSNLVGNAIKFTHVGGIEVDVDVRDGAATGRTRIAIRVRDTGIGIAADKLPRLFKAFSQADDSTTRLFGGTGLGLAISQELARRMHGEITVASTPGEGTTFTCTVELGCGTAAPSNVVPGMTEAVDATPGPVADGRRVLLVEDNPVNLALGTEMLAQIGCTVTTATNGAEGVAAWQREAPALVLLDCHMPVMDGLSAAREIRHQEGSARHTPIVALTASAFAEDKAACLAAGMDDFLSKPYTFDQLRAMVARHRPQP